MMLMDGCEATPKLELGDCKDEGIISRLAGESIVGTTVETCLN
jgi:hypothetical protein